MKGLHGWDVSEDEEGLTIVDSPTGTICTLTEGTVFERTARAHLIAAAPDLRDALQELAGVTAIVDAKHAAGLDVTAAQWARIGKATIAARDALRKAVGLRP